MAFNDTLFQLGMDLTRSSPAQKEEHGEVALQVARNGTASIERASGRFVARSVSTHVTIDVYGISGLDTLELVETTLARCIAAAGATLEHLHLHSVPATGGFSGVAVLSDGHISFHSRPAAGYAALDIAIFANRDTGNWVQAAKMAFGPCQLVTRVHGVGDIQSPVVGTDTDILRAVMPPRTRSTLRAVRTKAA